MVVAFRQVFFVLFVSFVVASDSVSFANLAHPPNTDSESILEAAVGAAIRAIPLLAARRWEFEEAVGRPTLRNQPTN